MPMLIRTIIAFALLLISGACENRTLTPLPPDGVILAFGDSLTAGVGAEKHESYPAVLSLLSGLTVVNAGVSGEKSAQGMERLPGALSSNHPDLLLLLEGGNDILRNRNTASIKANLASMIEYARASGVEVVLMGVPEKNLFSKVAPLYQELAQEHEVVFIPDLVSDLLRNPEYKSDRVHLNAAGYRAMAQEIYAVLKKHGAVE